jgi:hypothetical protein
VKGDEKSVGGNGFMEVKCLHSALIANPLFCIQVQQVHAHTHVHAHAPLLLMVFANAMTGLDQAWPQYLYGWRVIEVPSWRGRARLIFVP